MPAPMQAGRGLGRMDSAGGVLNGNTYNTDPYLCNILTAIKGGTANGQLSQQSLMFLSDELRKIVRETTHHDDLNAIRNEFKTVTNKMDVTLDKMDNTAAEIKTTVNTAVIEVKEVASTTLTEANANLTEFKEVKQEACNELTSTGVFFQKLFAIQFIITSVLHLLFGDEGHNLNHSLALPVLFSSRL
ncbi:hypothetical protein CVT24_012993 [Panaeolus cyanescens]|uniref:Uncharacterized protein n=1 Tax=Panaeolus cyanescens TaxID=181874 RepID=A0A409WA46_9AGAR|nr:hypothetical protein CVT24_012993 [Panaeolus cyanescens]